MRKVAAAPLFYLIAWLRPVVERVWALAEPLVAHEGLEIVDVEFRREAGARCCACFSTGRAA